MTLIALTAGLAHAQMEACAGPFLLRDWVGAMDEVDEALIALDGARADAVLDYIIDETRCLDERVSPSDLGRLARQVSLVAFYAQDPEELTVWALLAQQTAGGSPWPEGVPVPERYYQFVAMLDPPNPGHLDDRGFAPPKGGGVLVDGRLVLEPIATLGVQHLLQVGDKKGRAVHSSWQTGAAFPDAWLSDSPAALDVPKWYDDPPQPPPMPEVDEPAVAEVDPEIDPVPPEPVDPEPPEPVDLDPVPPEPTDAGADGDPSLSHKLRILAQREGDMGFDGDGQAADCPWRGQPRKASVQGREVAVNRKTFPVRTLDEQDNFQQVLRLCGEFRAARRFSRWQEERKKLFSSGRDHRDAMIRAIVTAEPERDRTITVPAATPAPQPDP